MQAPAQSSRDKLLGQMAAINLNVAFVAWSGLSDDQYARCLLVFASNEPVRDRLKSILPEFETVRDADAARRLVRALDDTGLVMTVCALKDQLKGLPIVGSVSRESVQGYVVYAMTQAGLFLAVHLRPSPEALTATNTRYVRPWIGADEPSMSVQPLERALSLFSRGRDRKAEAVLLRVTREVKFEDVPPPSAFSTPSRTDLGEGSIQYRAAFNDSAALAKLLRATCMATRISQNTPRDAPQVVPYVVHWEVSKIRDVNALAVTVRMPDGAKQNTDKANVLQLCALCALLWDTHKIKMAYIDIESALYARETRGPVKIGDIQYGADSLVALGLEGLYHAVQQGDPDVLEFSEWHNTAWTARIPHGRPYRPDGAVDKLVPETTARAAFSTNFVSAMTLWQMATPGTRDGGGMQVDAGTTVRILASPALSQVQLLGTNIGARLARNPLCRSCFAAPARNGLECADCA